MCSISGMLPGLTTFDSTGDDYWVLLNSMGTVISGTSSFPCIAYNNSPLSSGSGYLASNALRHADFTNLGFTGCTRAFDVGAQNSPGLYFSHVNNIYVSGTTDWGVHFDNFSEDDFERIFSVSNTTGDMRFAASVDVTYYEPGNSTFKQLYASPLNNAARGIVFESLGGNGTTSTTLNYIDVRNIQVNRYRDTLFRRRRPLPTPPLLWA